MSEITPLIEGCTRHHNGWEVALGCCGQSEARRNADRLKPTHVISIRGPAFRYFGIPDLADSIHLQLRFDDVLEASQGAVPTREHIEQVFAFVDRLPEDARLLVHCLHGRSRSTAVALAILARYAKPSSAGALLARIRPIAAPNMRVVEIADDMLKLDARLIEIARQFPHSASAHTLPDSVNQQKRDE